MECKLFEENRNSFNCFCFVCFLGGVVLLCFFFFFFLLLAINNINHYNNILIILFCFRKILVFKVSLKLISAMLWSGESRLFLLFESACFFCIFQVFLSNTKNLQVSFKEL